MLYQQLGILTKHKDEWQTNIPYVVSLLDNQSTKTITKALWLLGEMRLQYPFEIAPYISKRVAFLGAEDDLLREQALNALSRIGRAR